MSKWISNLVSWWKAKHEGVRNVMVSHVYVFKSRMINQIGSVDPKFKHNRI